MPCEEPARRIPVYSYFEKDERVKFTGQDRMVVWVFIGFLRISEEEIYKLVLSAMFLVLYIR